MSRDAEERVIAYSLSVVAGVTAVGWFAWIATAARPAGLLPVLVVGSITLTLVSVPASVVGIFVLERSGRDWTLISRSVAIALLTGVFAATVYLLLWGPDTQLLLAGTVVALCSIWVIVPLAIGAIGATGGRVSMIGVLLAWPPSNLAAMALFVAPGPGGIDFANGNALALDEPFRSGLLLVVVAVVTLGPTVLGRLMDRLITVRVDHAPV